MTRKRYIKLMMAEGWDRNTANYMAMRVREHGMSYAEDYAAEERLYSRLHPIDIDALFAMMKNVTDTIWRVSKALHSALDAFGKAYRDAMSKE